MIYLYHQEKGTKNMKRCDYKKVSELSAWDLDKGCRRFINQSSKWARRMKKIIRKADRKRVDKWF